MPGLRAYRVVSLRVDDQLHPLGRRIGKFELLDKLGSGGFGGARRPEQALSLEACLLTAHQT